MSEQLTKAIADILAALRDPQNEDLLTAVKNHEGPFSVHFEWYPDPEPAEFASLSRQVDAEVLPALGEIAVIDARSDEDIFTEWFATRKESALDRRQTKRFEAIVGVTDGGSGSEYEFVMQHIRLVLQQEVQS